MNYMDIQEMLGMALLAKESGFDKIQISTVDAIEIIDEWVLAHEKLEYLLDSVPNLNDILLCEFPEENK